MEVKKAIKKVVAFSAGATMVGATVLSAMAAADLGAYPAPFVKSGAYDAIIVVGDKAAAEDVVGAVDIGASLQYAMKTTTKVQACSGATPTVSNGIAIAKTGEALNYAENLSSVRGTSIGSDELPTVMANGKYTESKGTNTNDVTYTQKINLGTGAESGKFNLLGYGVSPYPTDKDAAEYIYFANNNQNLMYNYKLDFDTAVVIDNSTSALAIADVKDSQIEIQGAKYTITGVKAAGTANAISEITMMAGDTLLWLTQDQKIQKTIAGVSHDIQVVDVTESGTACGVSVDGDVVWIDKSSSETINGVKVGVTDAKVIHAQLQDQDICQINVGSSELKLRGSSGKIQKDGTDISNAYGYIMTAALRPDQWTGLNITFYPNDRVYLGIGDSYNDPVFGRFKFSFAGLGNADYEDMKVEITSDDKAQFTFVNYEGKQVVLPVYLNTTLSAGTPNVKLGASVTEPMLLPGGSYTVTNVGDQQGMQFYYVTSGQVAHVLRLDNIDTNNNKLTIKDVTYDKSYSDKAYTNGTGNSNIDLGSTGTLTLVVSADQKTVMFNNTVVDAKTKNEATLGVVQACSNVTGENASTTLCGNAIAQVSFVSFNVTEYNDGDSSTIGAAIMRAYLYNATSTSNAAYQKIALDTAKAVGSAQPGTMGGGTVLTSVSEKYGNNDVKVAVTGHGTKIRYDSKDSKWLEFKHPKKDVVANVFVAPVSADISAITGDIETTTLAKINLGAARLASEVKDVTLDNMIVVGGPCANDVAAQLMGQSGDTCATGFTEGKAIVKLYEQSTGKVAMLVAGYSAVDTRRATRVVAGYDTFKSSLTGTEVSVTGTSLTDISVSAPQ